MLKAGQRSRTQRAWMNVIAVSHSWWRSPSSDASCLPAVSLSPLSRSPTDCLRFFCALTHRHTRALTHRQQGRRMQHSGCEREGGSLALNNTGTRSDSLMEWSGWGWTWVGDVGEMWCQHPRSCSHWPRASWPLFGPFISLCYLHGDGWRVQRLLVPVARWSNQDSLNIHIKSKSGCKIEETGLLFTGWSLFLASCMVASFG